MKIYTLDDVVQLVDKYSNDINFGTAAHGPSDLVIKKAEKALGLQFTYSYKSFLKNYGGGDIGGEEIYSLYENPMGIPTGDIVYQNLNYRKKKYAIPQQLVVSRTDFGETFYFDYSQFRDGECPLYFEITGDPQYYASNFYEFLCKKIKDNLGYDS
ncbi:hypothetical protein BVtw_05020 [Bartonella vinsonii subsp. berkhoffii str. Tweed]|uniref:Knr4/Smi1-like domain-containing protein n=1 Tax=Bartonella vinsonii subsp. berkhoffii str. Tweed TaxID=1094502 RepID=N6VUM8_BARVB|nr:SMI1/KNR4 family protein [Bartonella vinsonii]ENN94817.1 hypothetical protein BVtw_05020 [Bartonella vinsonii subsp. berkhoffii str. Tweed]